jgi:hypothetical protein
MPGLIYIDSCCLDHMHNSKHLNVNVLHHNRDGGM